MARLYCVLCEWSICPALKHVREHFPFMPYNMSALFTLLSCNRFQGEQQMPNPMSLIKPKKLAKGDTIGLVAPASPLNENEQIAAAIETLQSLGFRVKEGKNLYNRWGYLAGSDQERAEDLNNMFLDHAVQGIITLGGGYGSPRILPYLNYEMIRQHPKVLMGYSDITALLNGIHTKTGLVTFHGPIASQSFTPYTLAEFKKVVMQPQEETILGTAPAFTPAEGRVERVNRVTCMGIGKVRGRLIGGNLSLMATLTGTPYSPDYAGTILILEDVGEATYRLDRMLTQLWLAGSLQKVTGIVFGKFTGCTTSASWAKQLTVEEVLKTRCKELGIPAVRGLMIGHVEDMTTLPIGCEAELDVDAGTLKLLETGVL
jgi:muramoyltetrapeptide carboxypeptidase